jgi:hypothetical protein
MLRLIVLAAVLASTGCMFDGARRLDRPARFTAGVASRQLAAPSPSTVAARTTQPTGEHAMPTSAVTAVGQFTMAMRRSTYVGVEAEAGTLGTAGSNYAAGYGVAGIESVSPYGAIGVELVAGRRMLRANVESEDVRDWAGEGRLRARFWLSPQLTFGAALGANPLDESWMAGVYLAVHSHLWNRWKK